MSIVTGTVSNGITLGQAGFTSPLLVTHAGAVSNSTGAAVYASGTYRDPVVLNQGTILDTGAFAAVGLNDGGIVANLGNSALIQGYTGIDISGAPGLVTNSGTIAGTGTYGGGVVLEAGGNVQNSGLIEGGPPLVRYFYGHKFHFGGAVSIGGSAGTVSNSGTIAGTTVGTGGGVFLALGGKIDNTGLISGGIEISGAAGAVANSGTIITGAYVDAAYLAMGGSVTNTGVMEGGFSAVDANAAITVTNSGVMEGVFDAVVVENASTITNSGVMEGKYAGVNAFSASTISNSGKIVDMSSFYGSGVSFGPGGSVGNTGLIEGAVGVSTNVDAAVTNSGEILGTASSDGVGSYYGGVDMPASSLSTVANTGLILGQGAGGVYISYRAGGAGAITNSGTIEGTGSIPAADYQQRHNGGVFLGNGGSIGNSGLIQGFSGVYVGKAAGLVTNSGVITGTGLAGVILAAGGTVIDSRTINGGNGTAVSFGGSGGNLLALEAGYNLVGAVTVAGAANTLELLGAAGAVTVDFDKPGAGFTSFGTVAFAVSGNHTETLAITDTTVLPGIISGFTQRHDIVDLTQLAPKHATATLNAADQLVVGNGSQSVSLQLDPSGNYSGVVWQARPDGSGGTDVAVIHPGDPAPPAASTAAFGFAAATAAATASTAVSHYKGGASPSQILGGSTPTEHFLLASGHGPPFG